MTKLCGPEVAVYNQGRPPLQREGGPGSEAYIHCPSPPGSACSAAPWAPRGGALVGSRLAGWAVPREAQGFLQRWALEQQGIGCLLFEMQIMPQ